uniref:Uncharacterized protein n=1 Tax=mine drainage metagenome TaxID=410659 RepID=E6PG22_9ZZZZ
MKHRPFGDGPSEHFLQTQCLSA